MTPKHKIVADLIGAYEPRTERETADKATMLTLLSEYEDLLTRSNRFFHFTVSAWTVTADRKSVLMVFHNIYQAWSWIGGHADGESNLLSVAKKELTEETGVADFITVSEQPISLELIGVHAHSKKGKYVAPHIHLNVTFLFEADKAAPLKIKPDENSGVCWRSVEDVLKDRTEPHMHEIYQKLISLKK